VSLLSQAILITVKNVMKGRTWAEDRILEQPIDPIVDMLRSGPDQGKPVVAIYAEKVEGKPIGRETQGGEQSIDLKVYVYVPPTRVEVPNGMAFEIDNTGAALALNLIGRQVDASFHFGNPEWVGLFRKFVTRIESKVARFVLVEVESAVRIPCLEVSYDLVAVADADFGKPLYGAWVELDRLLRLTEEGIHLADYLKSLIEQPSGLLDYQQFQMNYGLTDEAMRAIGLSPVILTEEGTVPIVEDVDAPVSITIVPPEQVP